MALKFRKMHGLGNDFVIIDTRNQEVSDLSALAEQVACRRFGVGCDQAIFLRKSDNADIYMGIYNPDGSEAGMCGNAARCVGDIILKENKTDKITIETVSGMLSCVRANDNLVTVDMGEPRLEWQQIPLASECDTKFVPIKLPTSSENDDSENLPVCVSMGNPHTVFFVGAGVEEFQVSEIGPQIEKNSLFPQKTNVEFVHVKDRQTLRMRVWERGTGITLACGSGACASAVAAMRRSYTDRKVTVQMDGGDLQIEWREADNHVYMTGPVSYSFDGEMQS